MSDQQLKRNTKVDLLRVIGLFLVIAAHCEFPQWFFLFREFDIVLLMFVSGISFSLSLERHETDYRTYVIKRFRKLVFPVWVFLVFFFAGFFLLGRRFSVREILESFALLAGGILFIWVYRVFFTTALLNPFMKRISGKFSIKALVPLTAIVFLLNDLLSGAVNRIAGGGIARVFQYAVTYTVSYAMISFAGMLADRMNRREQISSAGMWLIVFLISGVILHFPEFTDFRHPPELYFVSYGLLISTVLYFLAGKIHLAEASERIIVWLSKNTMTIYMWHIVFYYLLDTLNPGVMDHAALTYLIFLLGSVVCTGIQNKLLKRMR